MQIEISQIGCRYQHLRIEDRGGFGQLCASLAEHGQKSPLLVVAAGGDSYTLIDGHARLRALDKLGCDVCEVVVLDMNEVQALVFRHRLAGQSCALEEAWLVAELIEHYGKTPAELAIELDRTRSWISRRLALIRVLPECAQAGVRMGQIAAHAAMKSLVPLARANKSQCKTLVLALGKARLSVRQWEILYRGWCNAAAPERERIAADPLLYLKVVSTTEAPTDDLRGGAAGDLASLIHKDLGIIASVCRRARKRLGDRRLTMCGPVAGDIERSFAEAKLGFAALGATMEEWDDARSGHSQRHLAATA